MPDEVTAEPQSETQPETTPKKRGRPKGSKNRPKDTSTPASQPVTAAVPNDLVAETKLTLDAKVKEAQERIDALTKELAEAETYRDFVVAHREALSEESLSEWSAKLAKEREKNLAAAA